MPATGARRARGRRPGASWRVALSRSGQPRHAAAQRGGGGRGGNPPGPRIGRRVQSQGRAGVGRRDLRDPGGGRGVGRVVRGGGARRAGSARSAAAGRHRRAGARRTPRSTSRVPTAVVLGNEAHGLGDELDAAPRRPRHHPDGRARRVAQRRHGRHRAVLRVGPAARGRSGRMSLAEPARATSTRRGGGDRRRRRRARRARRPPSVGTLGRGSSVVRGQAGDQVARPRRPARRREGASADATAAASTSWSSARRGRAGGRRGGGGRRARPARPHRSAGTAARRGHLHLVTQVQRELEDIFVGLGYRVVRGPRGRGRLAQLRGAQLPARPPGARRCRTRSTSSSASPSR